MTRIYKKKIDVDNKKVYAVMLYNITLVVATVVAMYLMTPWAALMLIFLANIDDEETVIEDADDTQVREALDE
jgi:hypothetical protein